MELNRKNILADIFKALVCSIVNVDKCRFGNIRIQCIRINNISVILGRNINTVRLKILNRMISSTMSVFHLVRIRSGCQCHKLVSETDCKNRHITLI